MVSGARSATCAFDRDHVLRTELFGLACTAASAIGVEDDLRHAVAIAQVDEDDAAEIAAAMDPAHQQGALAGVGGAQLSAGVRAAKVAEKIELYVCIDMIVFRSCSAQCGSTGRY